MTADALQEAVLALAQSSPFSTSDITSAVDLLRAPASALDPGVTPWTDEQLVDGLPGLAAMATTGVVSITRVAQAIRQAAGHPDQTRR